MSIKEHFISRFEEGFLIEADYSQLEVIVLAELSGDEQLKKDIREGTDVHSINARKLFGKDFTEANRRTAKTLSFQLQYGAGATSMAKTNGIDIRLAKKFIEEYYNRYKQVKKYHDALIRQAIVERFPSVHRTASGMPAGQFTLVSDTKRQYVFIEEDSWKSREISFSPTKLKNYVIQGTATGDIVPMMLGELYRHIKANSDWDDNVLLINTVHDSILLDVEKNYVGDVVELLYGLLPAAPEIYERRFGKEFSMELPIEVKVGRNWEMMVKVDKDHHVVV